MNDADRRILLERAKAHRDECEETAANVRAEYRRLLKAGHAEDSVTIANIRLRNAVAEEIAAKARKDVDLLRWG